jgi:hypothetical protein
VDNGGLWISPFLSEAADSVPAMTQNWRHLPAPARPIAAAALAAVAAARNQDKDALAEAADDLAALDPGQVGLILGTTVRVLLEDLHPDGLDGDDVRTVLERSVRASAVWEADVDPHVVLVLLAGALGVYEDDGVPQPKPESLARHAALLMADLIGGAPLPASGAGADDERVAAYLTAALREIERAQLND